MILNDEKINYLLESMGVDNPTEPSFVISDVAAGVVQVVHAGTAEECLQFMAAEEFPDDMSFVTEENFESFEPELVRPN